MFFDPENHSHRRYNPLTGEWIQVSPHRAKRPWQGQVEEAQPSTVPYDPQCYLCPGNKRSNGTVNPDYKSVYAFTNDFSAIISDVPDGEVDEGNGLLKARSEKGICRVICFSPRHDLTIPEMSVSGITEVVNLWINEYQTLASEPFINYIQIFENKGAMMGCSNPHPHGQIWAQQSIPMEPFKKQQSQLGYYQRNGTTLLSDYIALESRKQQRVVVENEHFIALVPFWAVWPFETMIVPKRAMARITEMNPDEVEAFAAIYKELTTRYDNLFNVSFPYSAGIHQAPSDGELHSEWHWHFVFYPPLLRSASVKKFMVGYEMLANPQRDITPETSAERLRAVSAVHYKESNAS